MFSENVVVEILDREKQKCKNCGAALWRGNKVGYCRSCFLKLKRNGKV